MKLFAGSLLALVNAARAESLLPYNPTRIFSPANSSFAWVFTGDSLQVIDTTKSFTDAQSALNTITSPLPFQSEDSAPYTPILEGDGNITVVAGDCSAGATGTGIWRFTRDGESKTGNGTWTQHQTTSQSLGTQAQSAGTNYLAGGAAFSADMKDEDADLYVFGGMCPLANTTADTWISAANYSNLMLSFSLEGSGTTPLDYNVDIATSSLRGPPIAEAGFSMIGLEPTFSSNAGGEDQTQQQEFIFIGGHTQAAFINMSQVALYSLPQQSWTYFPVDQPGSAKSDLAVRQDAERVEPRSGHTAVLSPDGSTVTVLGGWVGDVSTPAQPQLAILHLGSGYGGTAQDWSWSIPAQSGRGLPAGTGIYGHGATMLPGGIMMVLGGYSIPAASAKLARSVTQSANTNAYLYNTTSNSWISFYTPPENSLPQGNGKADSGVLSKTSQQAGLGIGLGVGVLILISLLIFYFWYTRRLQQLREERERALLTHSSDGSYGLPDQPFLEKAGVPDITHDPYAVGRYFNDRERVASGGHKPPGDYPEMAGATGAFVNVPSPTRGLRKGLAARPYSYHAAPRYDDKRVSKGSGGIHPIFEQEDEDAKSVTAGLYDPVGTRGSERRLNDVAQILDGSPERTLMELERALTATLPQERDPFHDPDPNPLGSHPVSSTPGETVRRVPTRAGRAESPPRGSLAIDNEGNWTTFHDDDRAGMHHGRVSPTKTDDRTSSTLSEQSQRSQTTNTSVTRTMSTRTGALLAAAFARRQDADCGDASNSSGGVRTNTMSSGRTSPFYWQTRAQSLTNDSARPGASRLAERSIDSFATARTSFAQLQHEGETLLGGRATALDRDDPYQRAMAATDPSQRPSTQRDDAAPAPTIPTRRGQGLMGSLRRALTAISTGDRTFSLTTSAGASEPCEDNPATRASSPIKQRKRGANPNAPRRAVSDGTALLRQKRGQKDWDEKGWVPYRDDPDPGDWGEPRRTSSSSVEKTQAEEDWDVEGAANRREFQVMFTVPKARLRVVNADVERASLRSVSDGSVGRAGSFRGARSGLGSVRVAGRKEEEVEEPLSAAKEEEEGGLPNLLMGGKAKGI